VMVAVPFVTPVTLPVGSTVATAMFDDDHVTVRDLGFRSVAVSFAVCPSSSVSVVGATSTAGGDGLVESQPLTTRAVAAASST